METVKIKVAWRFRAFSKYKPFSTMPPNQTSKKIFISTRQFVGDVGQLALGAVLCAVAVNGILVPKGFATGGLTGLSILIHNYVPVNLGLIFLFGNIPLFILAWMTVGRRFFFYSLVGAGFISLAIALVHVDIRLDDKMLSALLAGIIAGAGVGISLRSSGSQGGVDILSIFLLKRFSIGIGTTILVTNTVVLMLVGYLHSLESLLYTLIVIFVSSRMIEVVVTGLSQRKSVFIISPKWREISREILKDIRRGVTVMEGEGGYTGNREHILYTVVTLREVGDLKRLIQAIDDDAFVVISDTMEVINYRIGNQPHW